MLDNELKSQLQSYFAKLTRPVEITASRDASEKSQELRTLLTDIAGLSPQPRGILANVMRQFAVAAVT